MRAIIVALAVIMPCGAFSQISAPVNQAPPTAQLTQSEQTQLALAWATLENAQLKLQLTATEIEKAHVGWHYDFQTRQLVANQLPGAAPPKVEPKKEK